MGRQYSVKGSTLQSKLDYVTEHYGATGTESLRELLEKEGIDTILESAWYPYDVYDRLLLEISHRFLGGDVSRLSLVGEYSARKALESTYRAFAKSGDFLRFLERISFLHGKFYDQGEMTVGIGDDGRSCTISVAGAPRCTEPDFYVAKGFYVGAAHLMGIEEVRVQSELGASSYRFELEWS